MKSSKKAFNKWISCPGNEHEHDNDNDNDEDNKPGLAAQLITQIKEEMGRECVVEHQKNAKTLTSASEMFRRFLRGTVDLKTWRNEDASEWYEYYSSNCCRVAEDCVVSNNALA
jgi:hypothetical protein